MRIEVSDGEMADKYSILCLKMERVEDVHKKKHLLYEKEMLHDGVMPLIRRSPLYYQLLCHVNRQIWDKTNQIKSHNPYLDPSGYAQLASEIFSHNDQRFRLKRVFNTHSHVKEQKSYVEKTLHLATPDEATLRQNIAKMIYLVLEYDHVHIQGGVMGGWSHLFPPHFIIENGDGRMDIRDVCTPDQDALSLIHDFILSHT